MKGKRKEKGKKRRLYGIKTVAVIVATVMAVSSTAVPAFAATTPVAGTKTTTFDKYLVMKKNANVPNAEFTYSITAPSDTEMNSLPNPEDTNKTNLTVKKGIGTPTVSSTKFKAGDTTFDSAQVARTNKDSKTYDDKKADQVSVGDGYKYAKHESTVDFSGVTFSEPGVYRYKIAENVPEEKERGIAYDPSLRYLDVYVESDNDGNLSIKGYVFHTMNAVQPKGSKNSQGEYDTSSNPEGKNHGFTNLYITKDLTLTKTVTGNQGFRDQYFKFHVDITSLDGEARLFLTDGSGSRTAYTSSDTVHYKYNPDTGKRDGDKTPQKRFVATTGKIEDITEGETDAKGLAITADVSNGESLKVNGLTYTEEAGPAPAEGATNGAKYTITETSEDYSATASKIVAKTPILTSSPVHNTTTMNVVAGTDKTPAVSLLGAPNDGIKPLALAHNKDDHTDATDTQTLAGDEAVAFINNREGVLPTGIYHNNRAIFNIIGIAVAGCAIAIVIRRRRKKEN